MRTFALAPSARVGYRRDMETSLPSAILKGLCPQCRVGKITKGILGLQKLCPHCGYDLYPEPGYYLGAMMVGFFATAFVTIPPTIALKFMGVEDTLLIAFPFLLYLGVGPFLFHYAKVIWAHLGYRLVNKLK